jgi:hypothetical protein
MKALTLVKFKPISNLGSISVDADLKFTQLGASFMKSHSRFDRSFVCVPQKSLSSRGGKMSRNVLVKFALCAVIALLVFANIAPIRAQSTQGRVDITVLDEKNAYVTGAKIVLVDVATNNERTASTLNGGTASFVDLPLGKYKLTVSKDGFQASAYDVTVETAKTTSISATLKIGSVTQVVEVGAAAPVMDTTSNAIGTVIDTKDIENLPLSGRDLGQLSTLTPGYTGTWNGLPAIAQGNNVDGIMGSPSRMKFFGNSEPVISPRLEDIQEMSVQTDQLDSNQGFGQSSMQINFTTKRGGNDFHGRLFEDFRNAWLNANSWFNNASGIPRPLFELNDFGGSIGGHIIKDKLFFFGSFATSQQPGGFTNGASVLTTAAQAGNYTYTCPNPPVPGCTGATNTVNLYLIAQAYNTAHGTTLPTAVNSVIGPQLAAINAVSTGSSVTSTGDPNVNSLNFVVSAPTVQYFPTVRVDYTVNKKVRLNVAWNQTETTSPVQNPPFFPGAAFASTGAGNRFNAYTSAFGLDWTISPTLVSQFHGGFLYNANWFGYNASTAYKTVPENVGWPLVTPPQNYYLPVTSYYPVFNASDTVTWQVAKHSVNFGFSFYREQDHYWNPPEGINYISLGLASGDPALGPFATNVGTTLPGSDFNAQSEARSLYALLTGDISGTFVRHTYIPATNSYSGAVTAFNLDELSQAVGIFAQDSWRIRPSLTINFGLRWDFTGAQHDLNGVYHNADESSIYGPSGIGNLFNPGVLVGNMNPSIDARPNPYNAWNVSPQPSIGIAWSPSAKEGLLNKIMGNSDTVIRAGFSLRNFTVPYQYFWNNASDYGSFFYQFGTLTPNNTGQPGTYAPGSLFLGQALPPAAFLPATYQRVAQQSDYTFIGGPGINGMKQDIRQPYTQAWNFGIQRKLGTSRALEVRYNGNRTIHQWINENLNEVNVFENGFLQEFKNAQTNMGICNSNPGACLTAEIANGTLPAGSTSYAPSFANLGLAGQINLPIMTGAFTGSRTGPQNNGEFIGNGNNFISNLQTGSVGNFASSLASLGNSPYFCNLVGQSFKPCAVNAGYVGAGAGYPINFFQANPYAGGGGTGFMTDAGFSNYNSLQVDFRQRQWHGLEFDANYTWSHNLYVATPNDWTGAYPAITLRNLKDSYQPALFDLRHVVHVTATADLPFGKGRRFLNRGGLMDRVVGGWTAATILSVQSGFPFVLNGGFQTFNDFADGGIVLNGVTKQQLQSAVGVYRIPGQNYVSILPPKYLVTAAGGGANPAFITPNTTPGTFNPPFVLTGPGGVYDDIMISKAVPITERWKFSLQVAMLNAFNHPVFGNGGANLFSSIQNFGFALTGTNGGPSSGVGARQIELRGNISF